MQQEDPEIPTLGCTSKDVPNDVLMKIFEQLPTGKVLECRRVSKQWKAVASCVCRNRGQGLKEGGNNLWKFFSRFKDPPNFPCSTFDLQTSPTMDEEYLTRLQKFLRNYATHIRKLILYDSTMVLEILQSTTNLQELILHFYGKELATQNFVGKTVSLKSLRKLKFGHFNSTHIDFLEFVLMSPEINLGRLEIDFQIKVPEDAGRVIRLFDKVSTVLLKIVYSESTMAVFEVLSTEKFDTLRELVLTIEKPGAGDKIGPLTYYGGAERFLGNCLDLEDLDFTCMADAPGFKLPVLPKLKSFKNHLVYSGTWKYARKYAPPRQHTFLAPLTSAHFPALQKISMTGCDEGCYTKGILKDCVFESVRELELDDLHHSEEWNPHFPNLRKIKTPVEDILMQIFEMVELEHVEIESHTTNKIAILHPYGFGDMKNMRRLKTLVLKFENTHFLTDFGARPLFEIQPLERLVLRNVRMSSYCKEELISRHRNVVIN